MDVNREGSSALPSPLQLHRTWVTNDSGNLSKNWGFDLGLGVRYHPNKGRKEVEEVRIKGTESKNTSANCSQAEEFVKQSESGL